MFERAEMMYRKIFAAALAFSLLLPVSFAQAAKKTEFKVCWSIYVGWMPWGHIQETGLMKK